MFEVTMGKNGLNKSYQAPFTETTRCVHCGGEARIGFTVFEKPDPNEKSIPQNFVHDIHTHNGKQHGGLWLHDCCAVAVYFCKNCLEATSKYNQG